MAGTRIVGLFLVRDEDLFVERAVRNVSSFCDELIFVDNGSRDETPQILARLAEALPVPAAVHRVEHPSRSHDLVAPLAGDDVWIFGVDGDELYDPSGLAALKPRLVGGEFDEAFQIRGNVLHCTDLDVAGGQASSYLSPPCASMTLRKSPGDRYARPHRLPVRLLRRLRTAVGVAPVSHKSKSYRLGPLVTVPATPFL